MGQQLTAYRCFKKTRILQHHHRPATEMFTQEQTAHPLNFKSDLIWLFSSSVLTNMCSLKFSAHLFPYEGQLTWQHVQTYSDERWRWLNISLRKDHLTRVFNHSYRLADPPTHTPTGTVNSLALGFSFDTAGLSEDVWLQCKLGGGNAERMRSNAEQGKHLQRWREKNNLVVSPTHESLKLHDSSLSICIVYLLACVVLYHCYLCCMNTAAHAALMSEWTCLSVSTWLRWKLIY